MIELTTVEARALLKIDSNEAITKQKITAAYRRLALLKHPDKNRDDPNAQQCFMEIQQAYKCLLNYANGRTNDQNEVSELKNHVFQPPPNEFHLSLTLEEIFTGTGICGTSNYSSD